MPRLWPVSESRRAPTARGGERSAASASALTLFSARTPGRNLSDDGALLSNALFAPLGASGRRAAGGAERFGKPSYDPILGAVATWSANRQEFDADVLYTLTTERKDFEAGGWLRYDVSYRYRLWHEALREAAASAKRDSRAERRLDQADLS